MQTLRRAAFSAAGVFRKDYQLDRADSRHVERVLAKDIESLGRGKGFSHFETEEGTVFIGGLSQQSKQTVGEYFQACAAANPIAKEFGVVPIVSRRNAERVLPDSATMRAEDLEALHQNNVGDK